MSLQHDGSSVNPDHDQPGDCGPEPRWALRAMTKELAEHGLDTCDPGPEDSRLLTVTSATGAHCDICVDDDQIVSCAYVPPGKAGAGPTQVAGVVLRMLGLTGQPRAA